VTLNTFIATLVSLAAFLVGLLGMIQGMQALKLKQERASFVTVEGIPKDVVSPVSEESSLLTPPSGQGQNTVAVPSPPFTSPVPPRATISQGEATTLLSLPPAPFGTVTSAPLASPNPSNSHSLGNISSVTPSSAVTIATKRNLYYTAGTILTVSSNTLTIATHEPGSKKIIRRSIHLTSATKIFHMVQKDQDTFEKELQSFREDPSSGSPPQIFEKKSAGREAFVVDKYATITVDKDPLSGEGVTALSIEVSDLGPPVPL
jgi:hypothetical protein